MVASAVESLGIWTWFVLAGLLLGFEIVVPGTFILWLGFAALGVGLLLLAIDLAWQGQLIAFALFSLVAVGGWWRFAPAGQPEDSQNPMLNRRADAHIGRAFVLEEPIVQGHGRVRIGDSVWRIEGPDTPAGARVQVTRVDGSILVVEPLAS